MKFSFSEGEGEHTFVAAGSHFRGQVFKDYKITGHWSPRSQDGSIPVEMKITYNMKGQDDTKLKGVFDPEENSLRGVAIEQFRRTTGEFVLKRNPDFVRFCPPPSITNAWRRWIFATTVVLDRVRQQAWSSKRILKRIKDRKRFVELGVRRHCTTNFSKDEERDFLALFRSLYEADVQFCASLINVKLSKTILFT